MKIHMISRRTGEHITACGVKCLSYDRNTYMDMMGEPMEGKQTWEGVTCQQCLSVNSASTTVNPSA